MKASVGCPRLRPESTWRTVRPLARDETPVEQRRESDRCELQGPVVEETRMTRSPRSPCGRGLRRLPRRRQAGRASAAPMVRVEEGGGSSAPGGLVEVAHDPRAFHEADRPFSSDTTIDDRIGLLGDAEGRPVTGAEPLGMDGRSVSGSRAPAARIVSPRMMRAPSWRAVRARRSSGGDRPRCPRGS